MIFIDNKYTKQYYSIIQAAKTRIPITCYTEKHHIIPKSLGGSNSSNNIAILTAREHFICHILLVKMTEGVFKSKMIHAAAGMKRARKHQSRYINSRLYDTIRKLVAQESSKLNKGRKHTEETRKKVSEAGKGRIHSDETKLKMSQSAKGRKKSAEQIGKMRARKHTEESKLKMSVSQQGRICSDETKAKMSETRKGKMKPAGFGDKISAALKGKPKPPMSEELKRQISEKLKGRPSPRKGKVGSYKHSDEAKEKIRESNRTRTVTEETRAKISAANRATYDQRMATRRQNQLSK